MITFECPNCRQPIDALEGRVTVTCESCGDIATVPLASEVDTLTLAELQALRDRRGPEFGITARPETPPSPAG
jgi:hypothetical protein